MTILPLITEKSMTLAANGTYTFSVAGKLNKHQISRLITQLYGVEVVKVAVARSGPKTLHTGRRRIAKTVVGRKKAYVTLKKGQKIDSFDIQN